MSTSSKINEKLQALPDKPGVYLMRDRNGRIIYVGKAASLRSRVRSYFRRGTLRSADPKLRGLIKSIADFETIEVRNEAEAVLTEGRLIKEYRPRYNVDFRDDKRFLLLRIDLRDPFPRFQTCRIQKSDGAVYFGPYASSAAARAGRRFSELRWGLRVCRPRLPGEQDYKHCMNDIIRYCSAPCVGRIETEGYRERADQACAFLRGERPDCLRELEAEMKQAADARHFERAAALRDSLLLIRRVIRQRARGTRSPEVHREEALEGVATLQQVLKLPSLPTVIECFDISNISGTYAVGSMVCAVDGLPRKNRYRHFRIKTVEGIDDPRMMAEVIRRRYHRLLEEKKPLPDLVLIDGGITQLRAAQAELEALGLPALPAAGLAKQFEEIVSERAGLPRSLRLEPGSPALNILVRIRDEAHRFALTHHRRVRGQRIRDSALDEVEGIGPRRKQQLLEHFGSVERIRKASEEDLAAVPGIGHSFARRIRDVLSRG